jgi:hypothetical protein
MYIYIYETTMKLPKVGGLGMKAVNGLFDLRKISENYDLTNGKC